MPVAAGGLQQHQLARRQHPRAAIEAVAEIDLSDLALQRAQPAIDAPLHQTSRAMPGSGPQVLPRCEPKGPARQS